MSDILGTSISLRLSVAAIRSVEKVGGLDAYLINANDKTLSDRAIRLKKRVKKLTLTKADKNL